jgi:hypothetical protein
VAGLDEFSGKKCLNLETYRKNGVGVQTSACFATAPEEVGGFPCDAWGKVTDPGLRPSPRLWTGRNLIEALRLLGCKYWPVKQLSNLSARSVSQHQRVVMTIRPI